MDTAKGNSPGTINIDSLIEIVRRGGTIRTGADIFSENGTLLLEKSSKVNKVSALLRIKQSGILAIPIIPQQEGRIWDQFGNPIEISSIKQPESPVPVPAPPPPPQKKELPELSRKVDEIKEIKLIAARKYRDAKNNIKKVIDDIKKTGGKFDHAMVETTVTDLLNFLTSHETAFSYLTKEIFTYDDYLYNHSINVCTIGAVVMKKFNDLLSNVVSGYLNSASLKYFSADSKESTWSFFGYFPEEMREIAIGFFMHDIGKVMIPQEILNKNGQLSPAEFDLVKTHSSEKGVEIMTNNGIQSSVALNISRYHHAELFVGEGRGYPDDRHPDQIPPYVKVCKLADIYDAMTSKRCYKEAFNPVGVVSEIFHRYAEKDRLLQLILHSFVKAVGIYPPGSVVSLLNGQRAYVIDSEGPILLPITDSQGAPLLRQPDYVDLGADIVKDAMMNIDRKIPLTSPREASEQLPVFLKQALKE